MFYTSFVFVYDVHIKCYCYHQNVGTRCNIRLSCTQNFSYFVPLFQGGCMSIKMLVWTS